MSQGQTITVNAFVTESDSLLIQIPAHLSLTASRQRIQAEFQAGNGTRRRHDEIIITSPGLNYKSEEDPLGQIVEDNNPTYAIFPSKLVPDPRILNEVPEPDLNELVASLQEKLRLVNEFEGLQSKIKALEDEVANETEKRMGFEGRKDALDVVFRDAKCDLQNKIESEAKETKETLEKFHRQFEQRFEDHERDMQLLATAIIQRDTGSLNQIRLREVLNQTQGALATSAGIQVNHRNSSYKWQQFLDGCGSDNTEDRVKFALNHFKNVSAMAAPHSHFESLLQSAEAMNLICGKNTTIRGDGGRAAHPKMTLDELEKLCANMDVLEEEEGKGMHMMIDFLKGTVGNGQ